MKYKHIVFDIDGTLIDTEYAVLFCQSGISHYFKTIICAENAEIDFALAVWGSHDKHIKADYFLERPADLLSVMN